MAGTIKHEWDGTTLIITSDSGTSSMDLKGERGDMGIRGPMGAQGCIDTSLVYTTNNPPTAAEVGAVPTNRKINEKELNEDIVLTAADVAAAPAGFGLGENVGKNTLTTDANDLILPGWYRCGADTLNNPYGSACLIRVDSINESSVTQTAYHYYPTRNNSKVRTKEGSTWSNWVDCSPSAFAPAGLVEGDTIVADSIDGIKPYVASEMANAKVGTILFRKYQVGGIVYFAQIHVVTKTYGFVELSTYGTSTASIPLVIRASITSGQVNDWEYDNPPMSVGTEYRTTERWNGMPVYTMLVGGFGALPNNSSANKIITISNSGSKNIQVIDISGQFTNSPSNATVSGGLMTMDGVVGAWATCTPTQINLGIQTNKDLSAYQAWPVIKYVKS